MKTVSVSVSPGLKNASNSSTCSLIVASTVLGFPRPKASFATMATKRWRPSMLGPRRAPLSLFLSPHSG
eukprot:COSAG06_NODE_26649_length_610_cov_0.706458_2_plen_68_part_01